MISLLVILEILILCLGTTVFLYRPQMRVSEAICTGIIVALLTLSFVYQTVFLIGEPRLAFIVEGFLIVASLIILKRRSNYLHLFYRQISDTWQKNKIISSLVGTMLIYLFLQAVILPPSGPDVYSYHLPRVLLFQQEKSLFLDKVTTLRQAIFPVGWNILHHAFLRFYTDYGLGIFSFLIYLSIGSGIYTLSRQLTSQKIAIAATLVVISMPQVVLQSTSMNTDSPLAGIAVFCFLLLFKLYQKLNIREVILLILGATFGLSVKLTFLLFLAPFTVLGYLLLFQKYSLRDIVKLILSHWKLLIALIFPVVIFSQVWLYIHNYHHWGGWSGPSDYSNYFQNSDGLKGTVANMIRYVFESIDLMPLTDIISHKLWQFRPSNQLEKIYEYLIYPLVDDAAITYSNFPFWIKWSFEEQYSWYGLFGFLLTIPSLIYTLFKGNHFVRTVSCILICFFLIVCYKVGWSPWRARYFSLLFVSSGICIAYTINHLSLWLKSKGQLLLKLITTISLITLLITTLMNENRAVFGLKTLNNPSKTNILKDITQNNIWVQTQFGTKRQYKNFSKELKALIPANSTVALLAGWYDSIYEYLIAVPSADWIPLHASNYLNYVYKYPDLQEEQTKHLFSNPFQDSPEKFDYLLCLNVDCQLNKDQVNYDSRELIWTYNPPQETISSLMQPDAQLLKLDFNQ